MCTIKIPIDGSDSEFVNRIEQHLKRNDYKFKRTGKHNDLLYIIELPEPINAFWIGCNFIAIQHKLFDTSLTVTG